MSSAVCRIFTNPTITVIAVVISTTVPLFMICPQCRSASFSRTLRRLRIGWKRLMYQTLKALLTKPVWKMTHGTLSSASSGLEALDRMDSSIKSVSIALW